MLGAVLDRSSPVDPTNALLTRAHGYGELPWVNDDEWFSALLPDEILAGAPGVLDLGCGPARLGRWLNARAPVPYVGVDRNPTMLGQANRKRKAPLSVIEGDLEMLELLRFRDWIFVVANVLHYLRDLDSLRSLPGRLGQPRLVCFAQTESADDGTLAWARQLFSIVEPAYSRIWHKAGDIDRCLELLGAEVVLDRVVLQAVDLDAWLDGWQVCRSTRLRAERHFDRAPAQIKAGGGGRLMVRRQRILHFRFLSGTREVPRPGPLASDK